MSDATISETYTKLSEISHGFYGKVYKYDEDTVVKVMDKYNLYKTRLSRQNLQELVFLSQFKHPNIVGYKNISIDPVTYNLYLEKCDVTLFDYIFQTSFEERLDNLPYILYQLVNVLIYVHKKYMIHGDIKPENIMINKETKIIKLIDWGGVGSMRHYNKLDNICTFDYCPPEGWDKFSNLEPITPKFDMWSLGMTLYFYIMKDYFFHFEEDKEEYFVQELEHLMSKYKVLPVKSLLVKYFKKRKFEVNENIINIIEKLLVFNKEERISSMDLFKDDFFKEFHKTKSITFTYKTLVHKPFLLKGIKINYNNKFRNKALTKLYELCSEYKVMEALCFSVTLLDKYIITAKSPLASYNYKYITFSVFVISCTLISKVNIYFDDYFYYFIDNILDENTKITIVNTIKNTIDTIMFKLKFKLYTETFDWILFRKRTDIDYDIIFDIIYNHSYNDKQNQELVNLYYQLRSNKLKTNKT
jgi:serine/threonine protein kinase